MSVTALAARRQTKLDLQCVELLFDDDVFAPTRCLEFFAAFGTLPERFELQRSKCGCGWNVKIEMQKNAESERVLAKVSVLIGLKELNVANAS